MSIIIYHLMGITMKVELASLLLLCSACPSVLSSSCVHSISLLFLRFSPPPGPQGPQVQKVLERLTGQYTVPNVFIGKLYFWDA
jgi:hypothetical protein